MKLDQHFMVDPFLCDRILSSAQLTPQDIVLEVGAGKGVLTKKIAQHCKVLIVEKDPFFCKDLENYGTVFCGDFFSFRLEGFTKIIANLPYSICEGFFWRMLRYSFQKAVLTVPLSFAQKLQEESKLSLLCSLFFTFTLVEEVSPLAFDPVPATMSAVILLTPKNSQGILVEVFKRYDMKLKRALQESFISVERLTKKLALERIKHYSLGAMLDVKVQTLSYEDLKKLFLLFK